MTPSTLAGAWGLRAGFLLLLAVLVAFGALFAREARQGHAAVAAERERLAAVASAAFRAEALRALDVAEARLEALDTLPLLDDTDLVRWRAGAQEFPRLPGGARATTPASPASPAFPEATAALLDALLREALPDAAPAQRATFLEASLRGVPPPLGRGTLDAARRETWRATFTQAQLPPVARLAWHFALASEAARAQPRPEWLAGFAGPGEARAPGQAVPDGLQSLVLRSWPWLTREEAGRWCLDVQRLGRALGAVTSGFEAACARGLAAVPTPLHDAAEPWLEGALVSVRRGEELRGLRLDLPDRLADVARQLRAGGALAFEDQLSLPSRGGPLATLGLRVEAPRLDAAAAGHTATLWWKTGFLALTALLGLVTLWLATLAQRRGEETLALQREFIATVSHELRTPLAGLRLMAETLERRLEGHAAAKDYPRRLVQAADGLAFLVENILSFNRLEAGRWVPQRAPFVFPSLEPMLRDDVALLPDAQVELAFTGLESLPAVALDAQLLRVLAQNLVRNAWKYGQRQPVRVEVSGAVEGGDVVLRVTDNGPGIPPAEWERVFEAFHRLPQAQGRAPGGSGLGLALARRIAGLHGGTLRVTASSQAGTTFELRLPLSGG